MKAISIWQPWATWIAKGKKRIETRTWRTGHRGPLLICAAKHWDYNFAGRSSYRFGVAVVVVDLVDCRLMTPEDVSDTLCGYYPDLYAWVLSNVREIDPFPVRGKPGIFEVEHPCLK